MNILILGNGFDLAHGLKTKYSDILEYLESVKQGKHKNNKFYDELKVNLYDNVWYGYLYAIYSSGKMKGINWIDFESEISHIIELIDRSEENIYKPFPDRFSYDEKLNLFIEILNYRKYMPEHKAPTYSDFIKKSYNDLRRMIRCIEIYLYIIEKEQEIYNLSPDIIEIAKKLHAVLCFNYTHTFTKKYHTNNAVDVHFIHGEINDDDNVESNNMVLGINEYYSMHDKDKHTNYNIYKKFTQRIINETGFLYRNWITDMNNITHVGKTYMALEDYGDDFYHNVYIFGHSLDVTDKDIIKEFIDRKDVRTIIYYHDKQQQAQQIANLVKMLGQENFISKINSVPQQICFRQQKEMG